MHTLTPPQEFLAEYLPAHVSAHEVRELILAALERRGWTITDFDNACVERTRATARPLSPGSASRMVRRLASQQRCDVNAADVMLTVCGEHLTNVESFIEQAEGALAEWDALQH